MEQQLKMVIMRSKMKNVEVKKEQRKNETAKTGLNNKRRTSFSHTQSLYSQPQKNE